MKSFCYFVGLYFGCKSETLNDALFYVGKAKNGKDDFLKFISISLVNILIPCNIPTFLRCLNIKFLFSFSVL